MTRAFLAFVLATVFFATPVAAQNLSGTLKQIKQSGEIRIGYRESEPPMSFLGKDGQPTGYSIDVCSRIVTVVKAKLNADIKVKFVPVTAENRFKALTENKIDILCGSTTKTLSRRELVDFTELTFVTGASLMTLKTSEVRDLAGLSGKKIGAVKDTTTVAVLNDLLKETLTDAKIVTVDSAGQGLDKLEKGEIDALSADQVVLIGLASTADDPTKFAIASDVFSYEPFALAVRRNDADFRLVADRAIAQLYGTGQILPIYEKWIGRFSKGRPALFDALFQLNATPE
ncbi:MAG: hypothetical protein AMJ69_03730 [Gammaproteobacteria bacterium SG8_47]|nr:MAG: hypothetical protein AMJ69_03730 [Gammaproteobacteria bacterium SG8_47]